jgi:hypothetical protein
MTLINMLTWWQWAILAAIPPAIVALYFLKLKRTPLEVPSTYLWRKSIEDLHVNSIWQRLRSNLLLFLQVLLVLLLMASLVRPGWSGNQLIGSRYVFVIDNSASMQSTDVTPSRLAEAKRRTAELIEQMSSGDVAMVVSFSDVAQVEQVFTDNRAELLRRVAAIQPTSRSTSLQEALRVAAGLANAVTPSGQSDTAPSQGEPATLYLFSDGKFPDVSDFKLGNLKPIFIPIGSPAAQNVAITAFNTRRSSDRLDQVQAFGRVQNFGLNKVKVELDLYLDDELLDSAAVELEPRDSTGVAFDLGQVTGGTLKLIANQGGELAVDDVAWTTIDPPQRTKVLVVTPGNDALRLALETDSVAQLVEVEFASPDALTTPEYRKRAGDGYYTLVVYDRCRPSAMPRANTLFIGQLPPVEAWGVEAQEPVPAPQIIDVDVVHPLMQMVELSNVRFVEGRMLTPPPGATALITTATGPLMAIAPRDAFEDAVLGAEIVGVDENQQAYANTDWPLRVSFPVFVLNTLGYLGRAGGSEELQSVHPGESVLLEPSGTDEKITVTDPAGNNFAVETSTGRVARFSRTDRPGVYTVRGGGQTLRRFAVNLFDSAESDIPPRDQVQIGFEEISGQANWEGGRIELWKLLLGAVLCVLCLEWYIYNRRVSV